MAGITAALKKLLQPFNSTQARRRQSRPLCDSVENLESRVLLSCVTAATDTQSAEIETYCSVIDGHVETDHVDESGNIVDAIAAAEETEGATGDFDGSGAVADLSQTFYLHSNPGATHTIYLDFDGHVTSGTTWNSVYNGGADIVTPAFNFEGDSSSFTDNELARIQRIWQRVAEDFLPFDVDVTTEDPGVAALTKSGSGDSAWGIRVVIGGNGSWYGSAGGVTYRGSFNWSSDTPSFVFSSAFGGSEKNVAEVISHEVGHSLGLAHDGGPGTNYYKGSGSGETGWAPIMGTAYSKELTQWSQGEYSGATNTQDDLAIITSQNGFSYRADDYGNSANTATSFAVVSNTVDASGIIERNTDVDVFSFTTDAGTIDITASPSTIGANLDILLELFDVNGNLVATANPGELLGASLSLYVAAGTYYLHVSGTGKGDPLGSGYSDYGSLGFYSLTGTLALPDTSGPRVINSTFSGATIGTLDTFTLTFSEAIADGTFTTADVSLSGPGGAITPTAVNKLSSSQYEVTFAPQSTLGAYVLTVAPNVTDLAGNAMDQDQDGINGEGTDDQFSTTGEVTSTQIIDDGDPGFAASGSWSVGTQDAGFDRDYLAATSGDGSTAATWTFTGLTAGEYRVSATWTTHSNRATDAPYSVYDGTTALGTFDVNQEQSPSDFTDGGAAWHDLGGVFTITGDTLVVRLTNDANDYVIADAIRIERVGDLEVDTTGPRVISSSPSGAASGTLDTFTLTFSEAIADGTFTTADVSISGPNGTIAATAVNKISSTQYEVTFASQSSAGSYTLTIGPGITDTAGNAMDQDQDGNLGEATQDQYTTTAAILDTTGPRVISSSSSGAVAGTLDRFTLTFSEAIADGTFTTADVTLNGPGGAITPTAVNKLSSTQYEVTFAPQTTEGLYTLTISPQVTDLAGNLMDQDQDGMGGEAAQDGYTASTVLESAAVEWHYDFGSASSSVEPGHQQVTESTSYNNSLGYGWTDGKVRSKARSGDALIEDFNWSDDATFAVDVPDGTYDVTITLGDTRGELNNVAVILEGQQVDTVSTSSGEVVTLTYRVVVSNGQLTLRLLGSGGRQGTFAISALSIVSSTTPEAIQVPISSNDLDSDTFWKDWRARRSVI